MQEQRIEEFDGRITPAISQRLHSRRLALGLSYERLAEALGVSWSTLRKWELGECSRCTASKQERLADFLRGNYDEQLLNRSALHGKRIRNRSFDASQQRQQRIERLCRLGEQHPEALVNFEYKLRAAVTAVIRCNLDLPESSAMARLKQNQAD